MHDLPSNCWVPVYISCVFPLHASIFMWKVHKWIVIFLIREFSFLSACICFILCIPFIYFYWCQSSSSFSQDQGQGAYDQDQFGYEGPSDVDDRYVECSLLNLSAVILLLLSLAACMFSRLVYYMRNKILIYSFCVGTQYSRAIYVNLACCTAE